MVAGQYVIEWSRALKKMSGSGWKRTVQDRDLLRFFGKTFVKQWTTIDLYVIGPRSLERPNLASGFNFRWS